jgi:hypothetical protein
MQQQTWDVVLLGRLAGVAIIFGGIALSGWNDIELYDQLGDLGDGDGFLNAGISKSFFVRDFLNSSLHWAYLGLFILAAVEALVWVKPRPLDASRGTPDLVTVCRVLGALIIVAGPALSVWDIVDDNRLGAFDNTLTFNQAQQFLYELLYWLAAGLVVILIAEVADRLRRRGGWRRTTKGVAS